MANKRLLGLERIVEKILVKELSMKEYQRHYHLINKIINESLESLDKGDFDNVAPLILLDEIATQAEITEIQQHHTLKKVISFIDHFFDAATHNFDRVNDAISITEGREILLKIKLSLEQYKEDFPHEVTQF